MDVLIEVNTCDKEKLSSTARSLPALQKAVLLAHHSDVLEGQVVHKCPRVDRYRYRFYTGKHGRSKSRCARSRSKYLKVGDNYNP